MPKNALYKSNPGHYEVPLILAVSMTSLVLGLLLPTITMKELVIWKHTFSILTGITNLWEEKYYVLALIILLFSVIFPVIKLLTLCWIWFGRLAEEKRLNMLKILGAVGKWSMLDVFVVAVIIVITKTSSLAKAEPHIGIYVFAFAVILSMLATVRIEALLRKT